MKINFGDILDTVIEWNDARADYIKSSRKYNEAHGHGVNLDHAKTAEEFHIAYAHRYDQRMDEAVHRVFDAIGLDSDERTRAYSAARALTRWYERTNWERLAPQAMLEALGRYIAE